MNNKLKKHTGRLVRVYLKKKKKSLIFFTDSNVYK